MRVYGTPIDFKNFLNSSEMNCGPLSESTCNGNSYLADSCCNAAFVLAVDVEDIFGAYNYFK